MPLNLLSLQVKQKVGQTNLLRIGKNYIRIHWRLLKILKSVWNNAFCYVKVYTFWFFANTPYIEMKYKRSKKFLQTKSMFPELQLITVLLLTCKHSNCPGFCFAVSLSRIESIVLVFRFFTKKFYINMIFQQQLKNEQKFLFLLFINFTIYR